MGTQVPVLSLSMFDPIHLGIDENGEPARISLIERNILFGGEPGGGKSNAQNLIVAHGALSPDCGRLILFDGKLVELGMWRDVADIFVGPNIDDAISVFEEDLIPKMDAKYEELLSSGRRKIQRGELVDLVVVDELAYYSATSGTKTQREKFVQLNRDFVARSRAAGMVPVESTQRPSADIIPTSLRDLFGYRLAFRCSTEASSDTILGHGWAKRGYCATDVDPMARGVGWLLAEGGIPKKIKTAYLSDEHIQYLASYAAQLRGQRKGGEAA